MMTFTLVDVILILMVFAFIAGGFALGLIRSIGALIGLAAGTWVAGRYFMSIADWITPLAMGHEVAGQIVAFLAIFAIVNRLVVLIFHLFSKGFDFLSFVPFAKTINRVGGIALGLAEGVLTAGLLIYVLSKIAPDAPIVRENIDGSQVAHYLVYLSSQIISLLPDAFRKIISIF